MKILHRTLGLLATAIIGIHIGKVGATLAATDAPLQLEAGPISGIVGTAPDVRVFKGIPFAAPPLGRYRWRAPQPVAHWRDVRRANEFGASCPQRIRTGDVALLPTSPRLTPSSEDCLYLNVWTAAKSQNAHLPVMIYFHGGGFTDGGGSGLVFDGEALAQKGVVLVTVNYRLGVFGFFAHPDLTRESGHSASGNYGLMDQAEALRWVQKNIVVFGGDRSSIAARIRIRPPQRGHSSTSTAKIRAISWDQL